MMDILYILIGLVFLFFGGEGLLKGSVSLAKTFGLSTLLVSMVVVGFGTSAPELMVSVTAALRDATGIALGNVVGSNIANILLILGLAATIMAIDCRRWEIKRDAITVVAASLLLAAFCVMGEIGRVSGGIMLFLLVSYLSYAYWAEKRARPKTQMDNDPEFRQALEQDVGPAEDIGTTKAVLYSIGGMLFLAAGAHLLVEGATSIARQFGISDAVIGLSLVAIGTSLPEVATAIVAAARKHAYVVIGNVMGSNLFNILSILGITALISPVPVDPRIAAMDIWIMLAVAVVLAPVIWTGHKISRFEGIGFLALYAGYIGWLAVTGI